MAPGKLRHVTVRLAVCLLLALRTGPALAAWAAPEAVHIEGERYALRTGPSMEGLLSMSVDRCNADGRAAWDRATATPPDAGAIGLAAARLAGSCTRPLLFLEESGQTHLEALLDEIVPRLVAFADGRPDAAAALARAVARMERAGFARAVLVLPDATPPPSTQGEPGP